MTEGMLLLGGVMLLYFGGEWLVGGASALALSLRVPQILIGLTVVAYGTSMPEVIVGVRAAATGHGDIALGNVIGSNISNIGLVLGIAALIRPARIHGGLRWRELPMLAATAAVVPLLLADGSVAPAEAAVLLAVAVLYTAWMVRDASSSRAEIAEARRGAAQAEEAAEAAGVPRAVGTLRAAVTALVGLLVLLAGGELFVRGAVSTASALGISERVIGLTVVAVGTSLPELVTALIAAKRGHSDLAVGNVIGSNIFNVFLCLGTAALAGPVVAPLRTIMLDLVALATLTALAVLFIRTERTVTRLEGGFALALYVAFIAATLAMD